MGATSGMINATIYSSKGSLLEEQKNIRTNRGQTDALTWIDYKSMPFTQCVINETLRYANIIGGIFRRATSDVQLGGFTIPKGWKVFASFRAVHMNENHFKDARTFNPWRWQSAYGTFLRNLHNLHFNRWTPVGEDKLVFFPTTRTQKKYPIQVKRITAAM
ncbi:hypothetical protein Droror1_Dr00024147 [Drosera rotundifolia]